MGIYNAEMKRRSDAKVETNDMEETNGCSRRSLNNNDTADVWMSRDVTGSRMKCGGCFLYTDQVFSFGG